MPNAAPAPSLEELRKSYRAHLAANGGTCRDPALAHALVESLEKELSRVSKYLDRSGTVYHMPRDVKTPGKAAP